MVRIYMATVPVREKCEEYETERKTSFRHFIEYFEKTDVKDWIIGKEKGKSGYEHYQIRFKSCEPLEEIRKSMPFYNGKVQEGDHWSTYEGKEGHYITSEDNIQKLKIRYGKPRAEQKLIMELLKYQSDREILVWYDFKGNHGKSWFCNYMYETRKGFYCPPTIDTVKGIIQFIASGYRSEPIIVIDIPRSWKWSEQLYTAIESIKDGLIYDTRYSASIRNIRGVNIVVLCNTYPKLDNLSEDRWVMYHTR